ncbi:MAG: hypothetical protein ACKVQK_01010 [Burkholderiales bacterium]
MANPLERSISFVPKVVLISLVLAMVAQIAIRSTHPLPIPRAADLPPAPGSGLLAIASLGDPLPLAKVLMLYLQAFDFQSGDQTPYQALDYKRLQMWLAQILRIDPKGQYPLMAASRLYADVPNEAKKRQMLEFVYHEFFKDPGRRWPWLAHATAVAKHGLHDLPLARKYAAAIQQYATGEDVPLWARQMEIFILEDMNELETARVMIGGYIEKGLIKHRGELWTMEQRLKQIEERLKAQK